ncbi:MAG: xanthine dehydrogenase [Candidatus Cloacimonetes bacterium 4572_55]|nr:MAG: xanthine dehydrogenase [Candidatus Cloacimonetes bacterium 4572_55]
MKPIELDLHTRGISQYVDDMPRPEGLLFAAVLPSPVAHGIIRSLGTDRALQIHGVSALFAAQDIPGENQIGTIIQDEPMLAEKEVHYMGQPLAIVVAEELEIARKAVRAIHVEIDELPVIVDPKEAYQQGEIIGSPRLFASGDVELMWEKCDAVVQGSCDIGGQEHVYLETQRARALPMEGKRMTVYSATQSPYTVQRVISKILGLPLHAIEVDVKRLGGAFGGKENQASLWAAIAAMSAWILQKPVELVLTRAEDMQMTGKRHPYISDFKIGATRDGKILAYEVHHYQNAGASADLSTAILERTLFHSANSYYIPNTRIFGVSCRTNLQPHTAFRGFGGPQAMFVMESALTKVAEALGMTREEVQCENLLTDGKYFPYGQQAQAIEVLTCWYEMDAKYDFDLVRERVESYNADHFETKKGFAVMPICFGISFTSSFMNQAGALVHVYTDGSVSVSTGGVEMGQGLNANLALITARAFGINPDRITVESTNTTRVANMSPSAASTTLHLNGQAALIAVKEIKNRLISMITKELNLDAYASVKIKNERVLFEGHKTGWDWERLVQKAYFSRVDLSAHGFYATPNIYFDRDQKKGRPFAYHVCGVALIEATVDCLRGVYTLDSVKILHDIGESLDWEVEMGQIQGALAQGLGWMTLEDLRYDDHGRLLSPTLAEYKTPDVYFMPDEIEITPLNQRETVDGLPYGNKAVGEPPFMYGIGAFFAIRDAMRAFRPDIDFGFDAPMTPERVLMALHPEFNS